MASSPVRVVLINSSRTPCVPWIESSLWFSSTLSTLWASSAFRFLRRTLLARAPRLSRGRASPLFRLCLCLCGFDRLVPGLDRRTFVRLGDSRAFASSWYDLASSPLSFFSDAANTADPAVIANPISTTAAARPATRGLRLHHCQSRSGCRRGGRRSARRRGSCAGPRPSRRHQGSAWRGLSGGHFRQIVCQVSSATWAGAWWAGPAPGSGPAQASRAWSPPGTGGRPTSIS